MQGLVDFLQNSMEAPKEEDGGRTMKWKQFKTKATIEIRKFMYGRNGVDQLTVWILTGSLLVSLFAGIYRLPWLRLFYYVGVALAVYRTLSRDLVKRRLENQALLKKTRIIPNWLRIQRRIMQERKTHRHFKCPSCKQRLRVPRGKGNIKITCSKCGEQFSRKS